MKISRVALAAPLVVILAACSSTVVQPASLPSRNTPVPVVAPIQLGRTGPVAVKKAAAPKAAPRPVTDDRVGVSLPLSKLDSFEKATGTAPDELSIYQNWASGALLDTVAGNTAYAKGMAITVTWEPWTTVGDTADQPAYADSVIASGSHDAYIKAYAQSVKSFGHPVTIRLAHEMNGNWYPWGVGVNGNTAADYIAMWRHVVTVFKQMGVRNVAWEWAPNLLYDGDTDMASEYPGDAYVDRVALSGYNWGIGQYSIWRSFLSLYGPSMDTIRAIAPSKPFYIAEIACATGGGDKAAWITDLFAQVKARPYIKGITWFDQDVPTRDWLIENNAAAITAWKQGVKTLG